MAKIKLDKGLCKGCMLCTAVCPKGLLKKGSERSGLGFYAAVIEEEDLCTGCALCAEICPDVAIIIWK